MTSLSVQHSRAGLPLGPRVSATAQALQWLSRPYDFLRDCAREFGDTFTLNFGSSGIYVLFSHPEAIRTIFAADPAVLHAGKGNAILKPFLGEGSLLLLEGEQHQQERRLLAPAFHAKRIEEYGECIQEAVLRVTRDWAPGDHIIAQEVMQEISLEVILRTVFGISSKSRFEELRHELLAFLNDSKFNLSFIGQLRQDFSSQEAWKVFRERFSRIDALVRTEVADCRAQRAETQSAMLALLLSATDEQGAAHSDDNLRDELLTLVVAGYETTATALAWALYWTHCTPNVRETVASELAGLGAHRDARSVASLPYLDATCREVLRIRPVIPIVARQVQQPFEIEGLCIPAGVTVAPCIYLAHRREASYPNPDAFQPERFIEGVPSTHEYLPFGGGVRRCIGLGLALYEMKVVLGAILSAFELELIEPERVHPVRRSVTIAPSGGPRFLVKNRT